MKKYKVEGYNNRTKKGIIKNLIIRTTKDKKVMIVIITKGEKLPYKEQLIEILTDKQLTSASIVSIYQNINSKDTSVVLGHRDIKLYGKDKIVDYIGEYNFLISPKSFFQVNHIQTEVYIIK